MSFGGGGIDVGPTPPTDPPTLAPTFFPTRSPVAFGSGGIVVGPTPPTDPPTISLRPSPSPTTSAAPTSTDTANPTPGGPFPFRAEGPGSFGWKWSDYYYDAFQHGIRRPGWSWGQDDGSGLPAPFCHADTCYNVASACVAFGGILLHSSVCSFPPSVKVAGPSCWNDECVAEGAQTCSQIGGVTVGEPDGSNGPQWCIFSGVRSLAGPFCYNTDCFASDIADACTVAGGRVWNDNFCILNGDWTTVGPVCWNSFCFENEVQAKCIQDLGGIPFANRWCLVQGCDRTVIGPTCSMVPGLFDQCFQSETIALCQELEGINLANRFCVVEGTDWTEIGPTVYHLDENLQATRQFCTQLAAAADDDTENNQGMDTNTNTDGTGDNEDEEKEFLDRATLFRGEQAFEIAGNFCIVKNRRLVTSTPFCAGNSLHVDSFCNFEQGRAFCDRFGGQTVANGFMCTLCDSFQQVVGPLMWNGEFLDGDPAYCEGPFCAIPNLDIVNGTNVNARCPASAPVPNKCEAFGGAIGIGLQVDDINNRTGDDDLFNNTTSGAPAARTLWGGYHHRWIVGTALATLVLLTSGSIP